MERELLQPTSVTRLSTAETAPGLELLNGIREAIEVAHIENASGEHPGRMDALVAWLRRRIQQIDAAISPLFLDLSARCEELDFAEVRGDPKWEDKGRYRSGRPDLKLWKIDEGKEEAISRSVLHRSIEAGLVPGFEVSQTVSDSPQPRT